MAVTRIVVVRGGIVGLAAYDLLVRRPGTCRLRVQAPGALHPRALRPLQRHE
jgi:hypothetical protein